MRTIVLFLLFCTSQMLLAQQPEADTHTVSDKIKYSAVLDSTSGFKAFLSRFLLDIYSGKNIDSLIYVSSPLIRPYIHSELGFGRFWNAGAHCTLYKTQPFGYPFRKDYYGKKQPDISSLKIIAGKLPIGGFCAKATSNDDIYYKTVDKLPRNVNTDEAKGKPVPEIFKPLEKKKVQILFNSWIKKTMYFVEYKNKWYLVYFHDCDCSA